MSSHQIFINIFPSFSFQTVTKIAHWESGEKVCKTGHQTVHVFHNVTNWVISDSWFKIFVHQIISEWNRLSAVNMSMIGERTFRIFGHSFSKAKQMLYFVSLSVLMRTICCWNSWLTVLCLLYNTIYNDKVTKSIFMHAQSKADWLNISSLVQYCVLTFIIFEISKLNWSPQ